MKTYNEGDDSLYFPIDEDDQAGMVDIFKKLAKKIDLTKIPIA